MRAFSHVGTRRVLARSEDEESGDREHPGAQPERDRQRDTARRRERVGPLVDLDRCALRALVRGRRAISTGPVHLRLQPPSMLV